MEKIKVSSEVATFINNYEKGYKYVGWEDSLIVDHSKMWFDSFLGANEEAVCMKDVTPLQLSKILIYGYEVEKTPEEKLLDRYKYHARSGRKSDYSRGVADGIAMALVRLGIEVKGITSK